MDRLDFFAEAIEDVSVYFVRYTRLRSKKIDIPIFVFEGIDDPKYYTSRISYRFGYDWSPFSVNGKENVLNLQRAISKNPTYKSDKVAFFVDRDFDCEAPSTENVYTTPCYAIENLYLDEGAVKQLLYSLGGLSNREEEEDIAVDWMLGRYNSYYDQYLSSKKIKRVNLVFLYIRRKLGDKRISLDSIFSIEHKFDSTYTFEVSLKKKGGEYRETFDINDFALFIRSDSVAKRIICGDVYSYRGKQIISFLREFILSIKSNDSVLLQELKRETGIRPAFKNTGIGCDLLGDLSSFAETPKCLVGFLDRMFTTFKENHC